MNLEKLNYIIFQLVRWNGTIAKEELIFPLAVVPSMINYTYTHITSTQNVIGSGEVNTYKEAYGRGATKAQISGNFGSKDRLTGILWKSGWERLVEFKELLVKLSGMIPGQRKQSIFDLSKVTNPKNFILDIFKDHALKDGEVYIVNFFDFYNNEKFSINLDSFTINEDAKSSNNLPNYSMQFTEMGDIVATISSDPTLASLMLGEVLFGNILDKIKSKLDLLQINTTLDGVKKAAQYANLAFDALGVGKVGVNNALNVFLDAKAIFNGKTISTASSVLKSIF